MTHRVSRSSSVVAFISGTRRRVFGGKNPPRIGQGVCRNVSTDRSPSADNNERKSMTTTDNIKKMAGKALLSGSLGLVGLGLASGTAHAFNPHPEPPGKPVGAAPPPPPTPPPPTRTPRPTQPPSRTTHIPLPRPPQSFRPNTRQ